MFILGILDLDRIMLYILRVPPSTLLEVREILIRSGGFVLLLETLEVTPRCCRCTDMGWESGMEKSPDQTSEAPSHGTS